jgi:hypothetical protein
VRVDATTGIRRSANTSPVSRGRAHAREAAGNQRPWPADKVERWAIDRLIPYAKNARTHTDAQVAAIAASIKEWGWTTPALVGEDGGLIAGHARVLAARQLGIANIPVMVAAGWSEAQKRAYVLADNQLAITGSGWDPELLRLELGELKLSGFDLSLTGFGDLELKDIMAERTEGLTDPDDTPAVPEHPVSVAGDLWRPANHPMKPFAVRRDHQSRSTRVNGSSRPFPVTQLSIRNGSSCPEADLCASSPEIGKAVIRAAPCQSAATGSCSRCHISK